eukprot:4018506-Prymnesium_polylepis.1
MNEYCDDLVRGTSGRLVVSRDDRRTMGPVGAQHGAYSAVTEDIVSKLAHAGGSRAARRPRASVHALRPERRSTRKRKGLRAQTRPDPRGRPLTGRVRRVPTSVHTREACTVVFFFFTS